MTSRLGRLADSLRNTRVFASSQQRRRFLVHIALAAVALAVGWMIVQRQFSFLVDPAELRAFIAQYGQWAPLVFVVLQALQVVLAPIPGQILAVVAGYLFGPWWGTLYNVVGITIGSTVVFVLSRRFGRSYVEGVVHEETLERFDTFGDEYARATLFVLFLLPGLPDDALCFLAGLTRLPLWQLVVIAVVGRTPAFFLANVVGDFVGTGRLLPAGVLTVVVLVLSAIIYRYRDRVLDVLSGHG